MRTIRNANVCVIGGAGFLGSHLVDHLIDDRQCNVLVLDNLITGQKKFINSKATFQWFDIRGSEDQLRKIFEHHQIEYVFNYAAEPYIPVSFERPLHVFDINAFAALKVMNAAQEAGVKAILQVSSAEIYGEQDGKITELDMVKPHSTYGASKMAVDALVQCRWREAKTPVIAMRQFNCLGERETHEYIVPVIIDQIAHHAEYCMRHALKNPTGIVNIKLGNNSFRDFQYSGDAVRMAVELLENGQFGEVYNMGSEEGVEIYELAEMIAKQFEVKLKIETDPARIRPWEIWHLQSDNTKLYSVIKTRPMVGLKEALRRTIKYYEKNGHKWDF